MNDPPAASTDAVLRDAYDWLAAAFHLPEADLSEEDFASQGEAIFSFLGLDVADCLEAIRQLEPTDLSSLRAEHARLFIGPFALPAPPYASCYIGTPGVGGRCAAALQEYYARMGLEISGEFQDAPDHIVLALNFLSEMCRRVGEARAAGDEGAVSRLIEHQRVFLLEYMLPWADGLSSAVEKNARIPFYRAAAKILVAAVEAHRRLLDASESERDVGSATSIGSAGAQGPDS